MESLNKPKMENMVTVSQLLEFAGEEEVKVCKEVAVDSAEAKKAETPEKIIKMESLNKPKKENMVTITQMFEFAGEEVKVSKEVAVDSAEAKKAANPGQHINTAFRVGRPKSFGMKAGRRSFNGGGGISAVLGHIGKKAKIGTLEKSKLDWERFKASEGLEEDIQVHNRGKNGFLEKQDFLQRADIRQFEIEKQIREAARNKR